MMNKLATLALAGTLALGGCVSGEKTQPQETLSLRGEVESLRVNVKERQYTALISVERGKYSGTALDDSVEFVNLRLNYNGLAGAGYFEGPAPLEVGDVIDFTLTEGFVKNPDGKYHVDSGKFASGRINSYEKGRKQNEK